MWGHLAVQRRGQLRVRWRRFLDWSRLPLLVNLERITCRIYGLKNYMAIVRSQLLYQGFIVSRWADEFDEARAQLAAWLAEGKLAHEETIMPGFESIPTAFAALFEGGNTGKMLVQARL